MNILEFYKGFLEKKFSALEITKEFLAKKDDYNAFITISKDLALKQAKKADKMIAKGENSVLTGVPMAVKDNILVEGVKNTCASEILKDYIAPYDATCVKKLKELGAVVIGKTNLDEFAMGSSTENSGFFTTKNPCDIERVPGGSSGGSAAAVAADLCCYALGSDTGGSIRQPASFCGIVGLKPTYGAVSRYGLTAFASSFDQIGPLTKTAEDARIILNVISGKDIKDSTSIGFKDKIDVNTAQLKVGIPREYFIKGIDPKVETLIKQAIKKNYDIIEISLPHTKYALAAYYIIAPSEASANLARFDGVRYGLSKPEKDLFKTYLKTKGTGFGDEVKRRIMIGTYALSAGYYDAYYLKAQKVRTLIKQDFDKAFEKVDVIMTPTCPSPAFKIGEKADDPLSMYLADIFTVSVNLAGLPAVSVPIGKVNKLPVGLQIIGKPFEDHKILEVAKQYA